MLAKALASERKELQQLVIVGLADGLSFRREPKPRVEALKAAESQRFHDLIADAMRTVAAKRRMRINQIALRMLELLRTKGAGFHPRLCWIDSRLRRCKWRPCGPWPA